MDQGARKRERNDGEDEGRPEKIAVAEVGEDDDDNLLDMFLKSWFDDDSRSTGSTSAAAGIIMQDSVTINGNEETCGSSFSSSTASVMAGVDAGTSAGMPYFFGSTAPRPATIIEPRLTVEADVVAGLPFTAAAAGDKEEEVEEEWLARVIQWPEI